MCQVKTRSRASHQLSIATNSPPTGTYIHSLFYSGGFVSAENPSPLVAASEIMGKPLLDGIWLCTKPLPWYTTYAGQGTVLEFLFMCTYAAFRYLLPKRSNATEKSLDYSGEVFCIKTKDKIGFIGCRNENGTRTLTRLLCQSPFDELISCEFDYPRISDVKFQFNGEKCFILHFVGARFVLAKFATSIGEHSGSRLK